MAGTGPARWYGLRPDAPAGTRPRPQYDPERTSLTEREKAKAAELSAPGKPVPASTVKHRRQRWEAHGLPGLADRRLSRRKRPAGRADEQVVAAMRQAAGETPDASSKTAGFTIWRAKEILAGAGYDGPVPSDRTLYRLFGTLSHGRHVTGAASTRRSLAGRPEGMFGSLPAAAPGEVVQVDPAIAAPASRADALVHRDRHVAAVEGEHRQEVQHADEDVDRDEHLQQLPGPCLSTLGGSSRCAPTIHSMRLPLLAAWLAALELERSCR